MTVRLEPICRFADNANCECGREGCITLYKNKDCAFCDTAWQILASAAGDFGLSNNVISLVDVETSDDLGLGYSGPLGLPTIRICEEYILGIPELDNVRTKIMHAALKNCFPNY